MKTLTALILTTALLLATACNTSKLDIVVNSLDAAAALTTTLNLPAGEQACAGEGFRVAHTALVTYKARPDATSWSAVVSAVTNLHAGDCIHNERLLAIVTTLQSILLTLQPATISTISSSGRSSSAPAAPTPTDFKRVSKSQLDTLEELTKKN
jgi:hypothetical protein